MLDLTTISENNQTADMSDPVDEMGNTGKLIVPTEIVQHLPSISADSQGPSNLTVATLSHINPQPSTSAEVHRADEVRNIGSPNFSPEVLRPFPKASARKPKTQGKNKTRKSAIYTDTPEKEAIRIEFNEKQRRNVLKDLNFSEKKKKCDKIKAKRRKIAKESDTSEAENDETFCLVCVEAPIPQAKEEKSGCSALNAKTGRMKSVPNKIIYISVTIVSQNKTLFSFVCFFLLVFYTELNHLFIYIFIAAIKQSYKHNLSSFLPMLQLSSGGYEGTGTVVTIVPLH